MIQKKSPFDQRKRAEIAAQRGMRSARIVNMVREKFANANMLRAEHSDNLGNSARSQ